MTKMAKISISEMVKTVDVIKQINFGLMILEINSDKHK